MHAGPDADFSLWSAALELAIRTILLAGAAWLLIEAIWRIAEIRIDKPAWFFALGVWLLMVGRFTDRWRAARRGPE